MTRRAIPADNAPVLSPVERVIVVGAGISGLAAAQVLTRAGIESVVVEARDRVGGRLHTVDLAGTPVDLGGSWVHHPVGNPVSELADQMGVDRMPADPLPELVGHDCAEGRRLTAQETAWCLQVVFEDFPAATGELQSQLARDVGRESDPPLADVVETFLDGLMLAPGQRRRLRQVLRSEIECEVADLPERQSTRWIWHETEYDGGFLGDVPVGGYRRIIDPLAKGVPVRLGFEVDEVAVVDDEVRVTSTDGDVEVGTHAVVTVPLGVLQDGRPRFRPPLPDERRDTLSRLGFGCFEKVVLAFATPFWRAAGLPQMMLLPPDPDEAAIWVFDLGSSEPSPTLAALVPHSAAHHVLGRTTQEAVDWLLGLLGSALGEPCPVPLAAAVTGWGADRLSLGSYSHLLPGSSPRDADRLGEPVHGRVLFAGEHTQSERLVYADGAWASGRREARRLLDAAGR